METNEEKGFFEKYYIDSAIKRIVENEWYASIIFIIIFSIGLYFRYS